MSRKKGKMSIKSETMRRYIGFFAYEDKANGFQNFYPKYTVESNANSGVLYLESIRRYGEKAKSEYPEKGAITFTNGSVPLEFAAPFLKDSRSQAYSMAYNKPLYVEYPKSYEEDNKDSNGNIQKDYKKRVQRKDGDKSIVVKKLDEIGFYYVIDVGQLDTIRVNEKDVITISEDTFREINLSVPTKSTDSGDYEIHIIDAIVLDRDTNLAIRMRFSFKLYPNRSDNMLERSPTSAEKNTVFEHKKVSINCQGWEADDKREFWLETNEDGRAPFYLKPDSEPSKTILIWRDETGRIRLKNADAGNQFTDEREKEEHGITTSSEETKMIGNHQTGEEIVDQVFEYLKGCGRETERKEIANYCICLAQGFITTFSGAPGTGKTTLCRLLAESLGLTSESLTSNGNTQDAETTHPHDSSDADLDYSRYLEVSVGRGWTDVRDFIGYVAPFQTDEALEFDGVIPANYEVCKAFFEMQNDEARKIDRMFLMMLDEANLSPMEYYWSQFLRICQLDDNPGRRTIHVGKKAWKVSPHLRFAATVNFDHTTEELSPRFLDRSWIIPLEARDVQSDADMADEPSKPNAVSMTDYTDAFGAKASDSWPGSIALKWRAISEKFDNEQLPISPRNTNAVRHYCAAAYRFKGIISENEALDNAILQKILPTINGYGQRYENLVNSLLESPEIKELEKTSRHLLKMQKDAEQNSNFYQFFIR